MTTKIGEVETMNPQKYNGWTNWETWNAALWLDNEPGTQEYWNEVALNCVRAARKYDQDETFTLAEKAAFRLEELLKDSFEEQMNEGPSSGWMADALNGYLSEVNWYEIAQGIVAETELEEV